MENYSVYEDIANRTGGDIYIGVVGPVRTGKSTFIKRFMETLVIPAAELSARKVMVDELPQAAAGKTVMTTEPKFVPAKAVKVSFGERAQAAVRLVDCVGFAVEGANGFEEDGAPRLVKTPWQDAPMPFEKAATIGTEKVIKEHSTIGLIVTTDGSVTDIHRQNYVPAEERAVRELKEIGKPFVIILNCKIPLEQESLRASLEEKYDAPVLAVNVEEMSQADIMRILQSVLFEFPVTRIDVRMPNWMRLFPVDTPVVDGMLCAVKTATKTIKKMRDCNVFETLFGENSEYENPSDVRMDPGTGRVELTLGAKETLYYKTISDTCGELLKDDLQLMRYLQETATIKHEYDKVKDALKDAQENGYGIIYPTEQEYELEEPKLVKKGSGYGVEFKACASGYHIVKVDVTGKVSPIIGTKEQGEEFVEDTLKSYSQGDGEVWETNIFGKSLRVLMGDELAKKSGAMPIELRKKMRRTVMRVVNEGKSNVICILF